MHKGLSAAWFVVAFGSAACRATLPSQLPREPGWIVAVKSCRISGSTAWYKSLAHHAWIDIKSGAEEKWQRIECSGRMGGVIFEDLVGDEARLDHRFGGNTVHLLGWVEGEAAHRAAQAIEARAHELDETYANDYRVWPGPNSNTFIAEVARAAPDLGFVFDPNCIGKDYPGWIDAGWTASKTGVRLDTVPIGLAVGLREGVELHLFGLTCGISLDPPGLSLPLLPELPWGWLPGAEPELHPPAIEGALRAVVDRAARNGAPVVIGELGDQGTLLCECADGSGWLQVDGKLGKWLTSLSREYAIEMTGHDRIETRKQSMGVVLDPTGAPQPVWVTCGSAHGALTFAAAPNDRVQVTARWADSLEALQAAMR